MAHKRSSSSARNGRDSKGRRLGVKCFDGQPVKAGSIIIRQRGTRIAPGRNVKRGRDHSLFALCEGLVKYEKDGRRVTVLVPVSA
jgi:large subunit ribosomal protein L27